MVSRIVRLVVETNMLTAGVAIVALVTFLAWPVRNPVDSQWFSR